MDFHQTLFENIYSKDYLGFQQNSDFNYKAVVDFLEFEKADVSKLAGISQQSVRYDYKIPKELKTRLEEIANICQLVADFFDGNLHKTALWFKTQNPLLGNVSPRDMIRLGRYKKLMQFIIDARQRIVSGEEKEEAQAA